MPLDRFALLIVLVVAAAGVTVFLVAMVMASVHLPWLGAGVALPVLAAGYLLVRVIADRLTSREDTRYDHLER